MRPFAFKDGTSQESTLEEAKRYNSQISLYTYPPKKSIFLI